VPKFEQLELVHRFVCGYITFWIEPTFPRLRYNLEKLAFQCGGDCQACRVSLERLKETYRWIIHLLLTRSAPQTEALLSCSQFLTPPYYSPKSLQASFASTLGSRSQPF